MYLKFFLSSLIISLISNCSAKDPLTHLEIIRAQRKMVDVFVQPDKIRGKRGRIPRVEKLERVEIPKIENLEKPERVENLEKSERVEFPNVEDRKI